MQPSQFPLKKITQMVLAAMFTMTLAACGGGGGGGAANPVVNSGSSPNLGATGSGGTGSGNNNNGGGISNTSGSATTTIGPSIAPTPAPSYTPSNAPIGQHFPAMSSEGIASQSSIANNTALKVPEARAQGLDGKGVTVGIVDSAFNAPNSAQFMVDGKSKLNLLTNNDTNTVVPFHGTLVATMMAGNLDGVAPNASINAAVGKTNTAGAIATVANSGAKIINVSMGQNSSDNKWTETDNANIRTAINKDALIVFSAGNNKSTTPDATMHFVENVPGSQKNIIGVTSYGSFANYCGYASQYCMTAIGGINIMNPDGSGKLLQSVGTSLAAPQVSGAAALILQKFPWASADFLRTSLLTTATDIGDPGVDARYGWGLLNVGKAVNGPAQLPFGALTVNPSAGNYFLSNDISGTGSLIKTGAGAITLTGNNTYTGGTQVQDGTLYVNGAIPSATINGSNAVLNGLGKVGSIDNQLGVADFSYGLKADTYTQGEKAVMSVAIGKPAQISGTANLNGTLNITQVAKDYVTAEGKTETVLNAGQVNGTFNKVQSQTASVMLKPTAVYTPTSVAVNVVRLTASQAATSSMKAMSVDAQEVGANGATNADAVLTAIDKGPSTSMKAMALPLLNADTAAFNRSIYSLSAPIYGNAANLVATQAGDMTSLMAKEMGKGAKEKNVFAHIFNTNSRWKPAQELFGKQNTSSFMLGASMPLDNGISVGAAFLHQNSKWDESFAQGANDAARTTSNGVSAAVQYGKSETGYIQGVGAINKFSTEADRTLFLGNTAYAVKGNAKGYVAQFGVNTGKSFALSKNLRIEPVVGARYDWTRLNGFTESGAGALSLQTEKTTLKTPVLSAGIKGFWEMMFGNIFAGVSVEHDAKARDAAIKGTYAGLDASAQTQSWNMPRTRYGITVGASYNFTPALKATVDASHQQGAQGWKANKFQAGLKYDF